METEYQPCVLEQADAGTAIIKYFIKDLGNARSYLRRIEKTIGFMERDFFMDSVVFLLCKEFFVEYLFKFYAYFFQ